jgi:esterase/lipase superfamily enzyme
MTPEQEREYREEAERLALLPRDVQRQAVALIRAPADNPKVGKRDREEARQRADALERHLRNLNRRKKNS